MLVRSHLYTAAGNSSAITHTCIQVSVCFIKQISAAYRTVFQMWFLCFGTKVNKMGAMVWKRLYSQADIGCDTCCNVKQFWRHRDCTDVCFGGSTVSEETEPVHSALFANIKVKRLIIFSLALSLPNRLLHSDFHIGRCARERDGVSPRAESSQGDRPGARHGVDWGLHR